jgi:hypothetical protein
VRSDGQRARSQNSSLEIAAFDCVPRKEVAAAAVTKAHFNTRTVDAHNLARSEQAMLNEETEHTGSRR